MVTTGAMLNCSFGMAPATLNATPKTSMVEGKPAANINDHIPMANIPPFAMCQSLANPTVAAATSAALGVLTPMPCVPVIPAPWVPGAPQTLVNGMPALTAGSQCMCAWGGVITISYPGSVKSLAS
jgi:uncharacterized Zn-binding protein involved in type VI secretion